MSNKNGIGVETQAGMPAGKTPAKRGPGANAIFGGGGIHRMIRGEKARNFKGSISALIKYMKPYRVSLITVLVLAIASTVFTIVSPKILGNITNQVVNDYTNIKIYDQFISHLPEGTTLPAGTTGADLIKQAPAEMLQKIPAEKLEKIKTLDFSKRPVINHGRIKEMVLILIVLYLLSAVFSYMQGWIMSRVSQETTYRFRREIS
jgi:ATP-binding cassette subfamily B multidrug efflux pump